MRNGRPRARSRPNRTLRRGFCEIPTMLPTSENGALEEGSRVGRYVLLRDADGCLYALTATAVAALCETEDGCLLMLPGGRIMRLNHPISRVLAWLS